MRLLLVPAAAALLAAAAHAQIPANITVGPNPAPLGSPVAITLSNDGPAFISVTGCPVEVYDANMEFVWMDTCSPAAIAIGPYGWRTYKWPQTNMDGHPMPPGQYWFKMGYDFQGPTFHPFTVDANVDAGLVLEGTPSIGTPVNGQHRNWYLTSPNDPGGFYWLMASLSGDVGIPTCGGTLPLDFDALFKLTVVPNKVFKPSVGFLNGSGATTAPLFPIPDDPDLVGIPVTAAFLVVDFALPCEVVRISGTHSAVIL